MLKITNFITYIIQFFYKPFQKWISPTLFRYAFCGSANLILDWILYFIFYNFVVGHQLVYIGPICITPHIMTLCIVFPITLFTGFWLNRNITFTQSTLRGKKQLLRYISIVVLNLAINYFGLKLCVEVFGWYPTPSKMLITIVTVIISYFGQKYYSFRK